MFKALWIEHFDNNQTRVLAHIKTTGAKKVCIKTDAATLATGMLTKLQKEMGLQVYGWRWPNLIPNPNAKPVVPGHPDPTKDDPAYWPNEMARVIDLIRKGLDGYIFDIESDDGIHKSKTKQPYPYDWDNPNVADRAQQAKTFATGVSKAFKDRNTPYVLGLTSHRRGFSNYGGIPWQSFLDVCNVLYPQTYWRYWDDDSGSFTNEASGKPEQSVAEGYANYAGKKDANGNVLPIIPVAGEIGCVTAAEISRFVKAIAPHGPAEAHFYVDVDNPLEAIGAL